MISHNFLPFLFGLAVAVPASASPEFVLQPEYLRASYLAKIPAVAGQHQGYMRRCIKNWTVLSTERAAAFAYPAGWPANDGGQTIFLEIGSSGFPAYSYIHLVGNKIRSNLIQPGLEVGDVAAAKISAIYTQAGNGNWQSDWIAMQDGNCYFLTIISKKKHRLILSYGSTGKLSSNSIIRKVIELTNQNQSFK